MLKNQETASDSPASDPIGCCLCMKWPQAPDEWVCRVAIYTCNTYHKIAAVINDIQSQLAATMKTNMDLVVCLTAKMADLDEV